MNFTRPNTTPTKENSGFFSLFTSPDEPMPDTQSPIPSTVPPSSRVLSTVIIVFGIGTAIIFTVHGNWRAHNPSTLPLVAGQEKGKTTRSEFIRNTIIDLLGIALVMGLAIWLGRIAGNYVGQNWGIFVGIISGMAVGFGVAFLVQKVWGKVAEPVKA